MPVAVVPFAVAVIMMMTVAVLVAVIVPVGVLVSGAGFSAAFTHFVRLLPWMHFNKSNSVVGYCQRGMSPKACSIPDCFYGLCPEAFSGRVC